MSLSSLISTFLSVLNSLVYTTLAFIIPLFFTVKALLRQYTVSIVEVEAEGEDESVSEASPSPGRIYNTGDDSEVPSSFIEAAPIETVKSTAPVTSSNVNIPATPAISSNWLHYWTILAVLHCVTGVYEAVILPLLGNTLFYHCAKYALIYWISRNDAQASKSVWTALVAPIAVKYERDADGLVQSVKDQSRVVAARAVRAIKNYSVKTMKTE